MVIEVIINSGAPAAFLFLGGWQTADVTPIIFRPKECHVVGNAHAGVIKIHHLFVEAPDLRHLGDIGID